MERWGQTMYVKVEAFPGRTSALFGRVAKELKAVELLWGRPLFPEGSMEPKGSKSFGYPQKETLRQLFAEQVSVLEGGAQKPAKEATFCNLLRNAGCKAQMPAHSAGELQSKMDNIAAALTLLTNAYILRLRTHSQRKQVNARMRDGGGGVARAEGEALGEAEKRLQNKHRRAGGDAPALGEQDQRRLVLGKNLDAATAELVAVDQLLRVLLDVVRKEGTDDIKVKLGDSFHLCPVCFESSAARFMVRSFCGHAFCVQCFGNVVKQSQNMKLQVCPYRCEDFQAVEVGLHVAFQGASRDPRKWMPPVDKVRFEDCLREGLFAKEQEGDVKKWNDALFKARNRVLRDLSGGHPPPWDEITAELAALRREGLGGLGVLDAVALTHAGWACWIQGEQEAAVGALKRAVERLREAVQEAVQASKTPRTVGESLGKTQCTLGLLHFLRRGEGAAGQHAREAFEAASTTMDAHGCTQGLGDVLGHLGVWWYTMGAAGREDADVAMSRARDFYRKQLESYRAPGVNVPEFTELAAGLNIAMLEVRMRNPEGARNVLPPKFFELLTRAQENAALAALEVAQPAPEEEDADIGYAVHSYPVLDIASVLDDVLALAPEMVQE